MGLVQPGLESAPPGPELAQSGPEEPAQPAPVPAQPAQESTREGPEDVIFLRVSFNAALQPLVNISVGGQWLNLVFDASSGNTVVFVREYEACTPPALEPCYSYKAAEQQGTLHICQENNYKACKAGPSPEDGPYRCDKYLPSMSDLRMNHTDDLIIDGLRYGQAVVEATDDVEVVLGGAKADAYIWSGMPVRLQVLPMQIRSEHSDLSIQLFEGADGILGGSGPSLSCRNQTLWATLLQNLQASMFAMDLRSPPTATIVDKEPSRIVFHTLDARYKSQLLWSQPKQTGDYGNDGMHEFLLYHPEICGVDMLGNTSSNWLTVIDTSGPCLTLPPFLFDRFMTRLPVECPFAVGEASLGRLCAPKRSFPGKPNITLPSLAFQLEDMRDPEPPKIRLPLERLVFRSGSDHELLCIARDDTAESWPTVDMTQSHIALGSLALSGLYTVVNLANFTVGLAPKGDLATESTEDFCTPNVACISPMQTYYPPKNICEDPPCSEYMFMTLDSTTKMCRWNSAVPVCFGILLTALVALDLISHRLYKQAIEKASEFAQ